MMADLGWDNSYWATTVKSIAPHGSLSGLWPVRDGVVVVVKDFHGKWKQSCAGSPERKTGTLKWTHIPTPVLPTSLGSTARPEDQLFLHLSWDTTTTEALASILTHHKPTMFHPHTTSLSPQSSLEDALASALVARTGGRGHPQCQAFVQRHPTLPASPHPWVAIDN
jgi:hypothetical protein